MHAIKNIKNNDIKILHINYLSPNNAKSLKIQIEIKLFLSNLVIIILQK
jgi:hypothetical protein